MKVKKAIENTLRTIAAGLGIAPLAFLFVIAAGNSSPTCGEMEPLEPVCSEASNCEGLPHIMCEGGWGCEEGQCTWNCVQEDEFCMIDSDCPSGQYCTTSDGECLYMSEEGYYDDAPDMDIAVCLGICLDEKEPPPMCSVDEDCQEGYYCEIIDCFAPPCDEDGPCALSCELVGECVKKADPDNCNSDADCDKGEICDLIECMPGADCDGSSDCFEGCKSIGICIPDPNPGDCLEDADCPSGMFCELIELCDSDIYCECGNDPDEPCACPAICQVTGICVDEQIPPECYSDADCAPDEQCQLEVICYGGDDYKCEEEEGKCGGCFESGICVPKVVGECSQNEDCPAGFECIISCVAPLCYQDEDGECPPAECFGECIPTSEPIFCTGDEMCPDGMKCEVDEDSYCWFEEGYGEYCMGVCVPAACPELACPPGFEMDMDSCECVQLPNVCVVSGCSGEICAEEPMASTCIDEPWLVCFSPEITTCGPFGPEGSCMWEPTAAFFNCLDGFFQD